MVLVSSQPLIMMVLLILDVPHGAMESASNVLKTMPSILMVSVLKFLTNAKLLKD